MLVRHLILSILIVLAAGCSRTEFAYRNADWFLESYAKKTVAASSVQIEQWRPTLQTELERHRVELLPLLVAYMDLIERASRFPGDTRFAACLVEAGLYLYHRHAQQAVNLAVPLLITLNSSQLRHLTEYMIRDQKDARKRYLKVNPEIQHEARMERFIQRTERWTGKLQGVQIQVMEQAVRKIPDLSEHWLNYKEQEIAGLLRLLETNPEEHIVREYLLDWWSTFARRSVEYDQAWHIAKYEFVQLLQKLGSSLTGRQRENMAKKIAAYRKGLAPFQEPAQQPAKPPEILLCSSSA